MIALGMILLLSYFFVRKTIGFSDPIDRNYCPSSSWRPASCWWRQGHHRTRLASWRDLARHRRSDNAGADHGVPRQI